ncbi:MAG: family 20 glycosylhydrolase, partial [Planctomycetota bacterium]|nr:family 20 glycosylhydrolase [Planctomycetota bacterium]
VVSAGAYAGAAAGTATLLQLLDARANPPALPRVTLADQPFTRYRCLMIDVARKYHSVDTLKKAVVLCRFYKINYLQLHLSDDQAFTFPSKAFPGLATPGHCYTLEELRDLESFASARGVMIIPEIETPGHASSMRKVKPFAGPAPGVIDMASEDMYKGMDTLVGEICDVFRSTPYYHMGGDECWLEGVGNTEAEKAYVAKYKLAYPHELYTHFIGRMNDIVRKHGKTMVVWEGFNGKGGPNSTIPDNVIVLAWETMYELPQSLLANGFTIVNATWRPLYIVGDTTRYPRDIYDWNLYLWKNHWRYAPSFIPIQLPANPRVIGAQMSVWEQTEETEIARLRFRLPAMAERIWAPAAGQSFEDFYRRLLALDDKAALLLTPARLRATGLTDPAACGYNHQENWHNQPLRLELTATLPGATVRYTTDGKAVTADSPALTGPLTLEAPTTVLKARVFDKANQPLGQMLWNVYQYFPVTGSTAFVGVHRVNDEGGADGFEPGSTVTVTLSAARMAGGTLRYALDGALDAKSPLYDKPVVITKNGSFAAGYFDAQGKLVGQPYKRQLTVFDNFQRNLALDKPVTTSAGPTDRENPRVVNDGFVEERGFWNAGPVPGWWQVDLEKTHAIHKIHVFPYWDGGRYYQYTVEVSTDGKTFRQVVDMSKTTAADTPAGHVHEFPPVPARYVRVNVLKNSANPGIHLVEVRVFGQ